MCFLDFCKVFDVTNNRFLCTKFPASPHGRLDKYIWDAIYEKTAIPSGVRQESIVGSLLFVVKLNNLLGGLQLFCWLYADGTNMGGTCVDVDLIQVGLDKSVAFSVKTPCCWTWSRVSTWIRDQTPHLLFYCRAWPVVHVHCSRELGILVNCPLSPSPQIKTVVMKAKRMPVFLRCNFRRLPLRLFLPCTPQWFVFKLNTVCRPGHLSSSTTSLS